MIGYEEKRNEMRTASALLLVLVVGGIAAAQEPLSYRGLVPGMPFDAAMKVLNNLPNQRERAEYTGPYMEYQIKEYYKVHHNYDAPVTLQAYCEPPSPKV